MRRRIALTAAGTAALVLTAGGMAVAANLGILSSAASEPVGQLTVDDISQASTPPTSVEPVVVTVDEVVAVPIEAPAAASSERGAADDRSSDEGGSAGSEPERATSSPTTAPTATAPASPRIDDHPSTSEDHHERESESESESHHDDDDD